MKETSIYTRKPRYCSACGTKISRGNMTGMCNSCVRKTKRKDYVGMMKNGTLTQLYAHSIKALKIYFLEKQDYKCCICGQPNTHNGEELVFILDHINGDSTNNDEENLRLVCPNCDTQLPTFKSRNIGNGRRYDREYKQK